MGSQISCNQFYCQQTHFQPEWLSPLLYHISSTSPSQSTQFTIQKGICNLLESPPLSLLISKKLYFDSSMSQFLIPLHFSYQSNIPISFYIFLTPHPIPSSSISPSLFQDNSIPKIAIQCVFSNQTISIQYSHLSNSFQGKIKNKQTYYFPLTFSPSSSSISIQHSFESSSKILSSFSSSIPIPFSFETLHLSFFIHSSLPFPSSSHFSFYLD
jgi:hypothetical protein